ncbi:ABC transporter substrate-binding protein [Priestia megaterium]|uniref:ABC transporter substrate-binding protein n=1 Tax=Priestia megaterium TaxID=1404 RepID=UPI0036D7CD5B
MSKSIFTSSLIVCLMTMSILTGCSGEKASSSNKEKIEFAVNMSVNDAEYKVLKKVTENYNNKNSGQDVELRALSDFENTMKTRMAANQLPDIWTTHGWSVARYKEYLEPLNSQKWIKDIDPNIKPTITDDKNNVYVLPIDYDISGIVYDEKVLKEANVNPEKIKTWKDFSDACKKIKNMGKTPIHMGGAKETWILGFYFLYAADSYLIGDKDKSYGEELRNGKFNWDNWKPVAGMLKEFKEKGYINKGITESNFQDMKDQFAQGKVGFAFMHNTMISSVNQLNPNGKYGFIPIPSTQKQIKPSTIVGEHLAVGVWKDSKSKKSALSYINYLSDPKNVNEISKVAKSPTGLVGGEYQTNAGHLTDDYEYAQEKSDLRPYFDREYLPGGMWDTLCTTAEGILSGTMSIQQATTIMKSDYKKLLEQK